MTAYNRLNGTFCSEHGWLIGDVLRGEWGFDGVVISDWFGTHSAVESVRAGLDLEMPGPPRERGAALVAAVERGDVGEHELDPLVSRVLELGAWVAAGESGTDEVTATDPETRDVIRRAAARAMVLLKNDGDALPLPAAARRVALIGPYAHFGRPQGGGSARVRPDHGRGPLDALTARGFDVTLEPGGSIARYLPVVRGDFAATFADDSGASVETNVNRLTWFWDKPPADWRRCDAVRDADQRPVRAGRHGRVGDRGPRRRTGHGQHRRRARGDDRRTAAWRGVLRHG